VAGSECRILTPKAFGVKKPGSFLPAVLKKKALQLAPGRLQLCAQVFALHFSHTLGTKEASLRTLLPSAARYRCAPFQTQP
jgi:hypothetical protein